MIVMTAKYFHVKCTQFGEIKYTGGEEFFCVGDDNSNELLILHDY